MVRRSGITRRGEEGVHRKERRHLRTKWRGGEGWKKGGGGGVVMQRLV